MPTNIQALIDAIPIAEDGHVITSEYHNALRDAIRALAGQGQAPGVQSHILTFAPAFRSEGPNDWDLLLGTARKGNVAATGWFPVQLTQGARIEKMKVTCKKTGTTGLLTVTLYQQPIPLIDLPHTPIVVSVAVPPTPSTPFPTATFNPFEATAVFAAFSRTTSPIVGGIPFLQFFPGTDEFSSNADPSNNTIDNSQFKYLIRADLQANASTAAAAAGSETHILAIQLHYGL